MDHCCESKAQEIAQARDRQGRVLKIVLTINAAMFLPTLASYWPQSAFS